MKDEKSLLEEILDRKKSIKNGLLDNDENIFSSKNQKFSETKKINPSQNNISKNSILRNKNNEKIIKLEKTRDENIRSEINIRKNKTENKATSSLNSIVKKDEKKVQPTEKKQAINEKIFNKNNIDDNKNKKNKRQKIITNFFKKRKLKKLSFTPYIRTETDVRNIMKDVIISLFAAIIASGLVYGINALLLIATSVLSAVVTEKLFSKIFLDDTNSIHDLSAIITGILLAMTLAPLTPLPIVVFGAAMAVIFGKLMYGGIGKNILNPAVVGREFMTVFFSVSMSSGAIWFSQKALLLPKINFFANFYKAPFTSYLDELLLSSSGSLGSYSAFALILGGLYLLLKNRISWHIPVSLFATFFLITMLLKEDTSVSIGGLLLTGIFMATDMPTSPSFAGGKIYYGIMLGLVIVLLSLLGIKNETLSYVLIILNPFTKFINKVFRPVVFGYDIKEEILKQSVKMILLTIGIFTFAVIFVKFHKFGIIPYLVYLYILILTIKLITTKKRINY
ncbi:RnfABCDGE type electron transport complex subunit D [Leptotrichia hongkongensis]|uniref:RnfABCDGE type electron transport complex subunit D n=1 Tax=Leptotrichia hongkongensis TaxID=554406 RepID=UPI0035A91CBD